MPDVLALQLDARVQPSRTKRTLTVETRLSRQAVERMLAAFDDQPAPGRSVPYGTTRRPAG